MRTWAAAYELLFNDMVCAANKRPVWFAYRGYPKVTSTFSKLHISETTEGPPGGWSGLSTWGRGIQGLHPVPELTGEVCLSIAARSELRGLGRSRLCRLHRLLMTRKGHIREMACL